MKVIRYCYRQAFDDEITKHPIDDVRSLGMDVLNYESFPIADCGFMEVDKIIDDLPKRIEKSDVESIDDLLKIKII